MRTLPVFLRNLPQVHRYCWWFVRVFLLFRRPFRFLAHYLLQTSPAGGVVELRDGTRIYLSGHPHDVITLFVIFVREDYGRLERAATVVDIGANIGAFALYAARSGARKVLAYEPNTASFRCLERNVQANRVEAIVAARRFAVAGRAGQQVRFPVAPSVYSRIARDGEAGEFETVRTTSLAEILERDAPQGIDLLKLDCEGAEYDILFESQAALARVREIRMEYHLGRSGELIEFLRRCGFEIALFRPDGASSGNLWARKPQSPRP